MNRLFRRLIVLFFLVSCGLFAAVTFLASKDVDTGGPVITVENDEIEVSVKTKGKDLLEGVTAYDKKDGDVTDQLVIESLSNFIDLKEHKRQITIVAFDKDDNVSKATRTIRYTDYESPKFAFSEPLRFATSGSIKGLVDNITATDVLDGDITENISMTGVGGVNVVVEPGTYNVEIQTFNSAGDTSVLDVTLEYYDASDDVSVPHVILSDYLVYVKKGIYFDAEKYIKGIQVGNKEYTLEQMRADDSPYKDAEIVIDNPVDSQKEGTYEVTYTMESSGGAKSNIRLVVILE